MRKGTLTFLTNTWMSSLRYDRQTILHIPASQYPVNWTKGQVVVRPTEGFATLFSHKKGGDSDYTEIKENILKETIIPANAGTAQVSAVQLRNSFIGGAPLVQGTNPGAIVIKPAGLLQPEKDQWYIVPIWEVSKPRLKPEANPAAAASTGLKREGKRKCNHAAGSVSEFLRLPC